MIAKRRARKRSLIRSNIVNAARAGILSPMDGAAAFQMGPSDLAHTTQFSPRAAPPSDSSIYLRQLSTLHTAGVLTDEEFSAASSRLMGS